MIRVHRHVDAPPDHARRTDKLPGMLSMGRAHCHLLVLGIPGQSRMELRHLVAVVRDRLISVLRSVLADEEPERENHEARAAGRRRRDLGNHADSSTEAAADVPPLSIRGSASGRWMTERREEYTLTPRGQQETVALWIARKSDAC